jgi:hypothetical protein
MRQRQVLVKQYAVAPDRLWAAIKQVLITVDGITLEQADDAQKTAIFKTGVTWTSWGQNMIARLQPINAEQVQLQINGQIRHTFLASDWGEKLHQKEFVRHLTAALDDVMTHQSYEAR